MGDLRDKGKGKHMRCAFVVPETLQLDRAT